MIVERQWIYPSSKMTSTVRYTITNGRVNINLDLETKKRLFGFPHEKFIEFINAVNAECKQIKFTRQLDEVLILLSIIPPVLLIGGVLGMIFWNWIVMLPVTAGVVILMYVIIVVVGYIVGRKKSKHIRAVKDLIERKNLEFEGFMKINVQLYYWKLDLGSYFDRPEYLEITYVENH